MLPRHVSRALALALLLAPLGARADETLVARVKVGGGTSVNAQTILVPTVLLHLSVDGTASSMSKKGGANEQVKGSFQVDGIDRGFAQDLATQVQNDFVARLRAAGYTVLTYDDIQDDPMAAKLDRREVDERFGLPYRDDKTTSIHHVIAPPSDAQAFKPSIQGPHHAFKNVAKERNAVVIVPEIWIAAPQMWGEKEGGDTSASAEIHIAPGMNVSAATAWFIHPKAAGGTVQLEGHLRNVVETAGTLANLGGGKTEAGFAKRMRAAWTLTIDPAAYAAGVMRGAGAFNAAVIEAITQENPARPSASN